eukprot:gene8498-8680_t
MDAERVSITSAFDSGNIEVVESNDIANIQLKIRPDPFTVSENCAHYQWFHYQVAGAKQQPLTMRIINAGQSSYPEAWQGYKACASYDLQHWFRVQSTSYDPQTGTLTIRHTPEQPCVRYAYFAPYSLERHAALIAKMQPRPQVSLHVLGQSLDGRDITMLQVGTPAPDKAVIWVIARQHPGESMAEWFVEGLLERLTADGPSAGADADVVALLQSAVLYVVPNMCPDGSVRGHLRTNACGANLNREWADPSLDRSPEVVAASSAIAATGLDMLLDVHGDEDIPANFIGSMFGVPAWGPRLERMQQTFIDALLAASPDFQTALGYPLPPPGAANLATASKANAQKYNTLSLVLEQPFKDTSGKLGWCNFGAAHVTAFLHTVPTLLKERATK